MRLTRGVCWRNSSAFIVPARVFTYSPTYSHTAGDAVDRLQKTVQEPLFSISRRDAKTRPCIPGLLGIKGLRARVGNTRRLRTGPEGLRSAGIYCRNCWSLPPYATRRNVRGTSRVRGGGLMTSGAVEPRYASATEADKVNAVLLLFCGFRFVCAVC